MDMLLGNNDAAARLKTINNEFFFLCVEQNICATSRPPIAIIAIYCTIVVLWGILKEQGECETSCAM